MILHLLCLSLLSPSVSLCILLLPLHCHVSFRLPLSIINSFSFYLPHFFTSLFIMLYVFLSVCVLPSLHLPHLLPLQTFFTLPLSSHIMFYINIIVRFTLLAARLSQNLCACTHFAARFLLPAMAWRNIHAARFAFCIYVGIIKHLYPSNITLLPFAV